MKISVQAWQDLRDFTREYLDFETPSGDLTRDFFHQLAEELMSHRTPEKIRENFFAMVAKWEKTDKEPFLEMLGMFFD